MATFYHSPWLPWESDDQEKERLRKITKWVLIPSLIFIVVVQLLPRPERPEKELNKVPERYAKLLIEKKRTPPPPPPKVEKPKKEEKPKETKKEKPKQEKPKQEKPKVAEKPKESARDKASKAGVMVFADDLADLRNNASVDKVSSKRKLSNSGAEGAKRTERSVITSNAGSGSGGINTSNLSRNTGGTQIASRQTSKVSSAIGDGGSSGGGTSKGKGRKGGRSDEEINLVIDRNMSTLYTLYQRATREDPTLQGKVVLKFTIAPTGEVTKCEVVSSEITDDKLLRKIVLKFKRFKFVAKDVASQTVTIPIEFFPS